MRTTTEADVTLVLDFLNTLDVDSGTDALETAGSWRAWAAARELRPGAVAEARAARSALRSVTGDSAEAPATTALEPGDGAVEAAEADAGAAGAGAGAAGAGVEAARAGAGAAGAGAGAARAGLGAAGAGVEAARAGAGAVPVGAGAAGTGTGAVRAGAGLVGAAVRVEVTAAGPAFAADSAVGAVLAAAARLALLEEFARIKICPADNCRWAFYDRSRNRSRSWCSMSACGNREKARAWRQRSTAQP